MIYCIISLMNKPRSWSLLLLIAGLLSWLPATLHAAPLIIAQPVGKSAFSGDAKVSFEVLATGSSTPTYQWQVMTGGSGSAVDIAGGTSSRLIINNPTVSLSGNKYRCVVTDVSSLNSAFAKLNVYSAPTATPVVTVTPDSVPANSSTNITIQITGLSTSGTIGDTVRIERVLDINGNGVADIGEPPVESFLVTDGQNAAIGGVRNTNVPGDDDNTLDGQITTHISMPTSNDIGKTAGSYLIRVTSPNGEFRAVQTTLAITQPNYTASVSGTVTCDGIAVPNAIVFAIGSGGKGGPAGLSVADASGNYTLNLPAGSYSVIAAKTGFAALMSAAPNGTISDGQVFSNINTTLVAATSTIAGQTQDVAGTMSLRGVQLIGQSQGGYLSVAFSDASGNYVVAAVPDQWQIDASTDGLGVALLGFVPPNNGVSATTTSGSATMLNIHFSPVTALVYGTVKDSTGAPVQGARLAANDNANVYWMGATTDASGSYAMGIVGNTGTSTMNWWISPDNTSSVVWAGLIPPSGQSITPTSGSAVLLNFTAQRVSAHIQGAVTKNGVAVAGAQIGASLQNTSNNLWISASADINGIYDIGVNAGTWNVQLDSNYAISNNLVSPVINTTIVDNQTLSGVVLPVLDATGTLYGRVTDALGQPSSNTNIFASVSVAGVQYTANTNTDNNGYYTLPVLSGATWNVGVGMNGFSQQSVSVSGSTQVNFTQSVIADQTWNQDVTVGQSATFSVTVNTPGSPSFQWQRCPAGSVIWSNLSDDATYAGSNVNALTVNNTTLSMSGDRFACVVSYSVSGTPTSVTSQTAWLQVSPPVTAHFAGKVTLNGVPVGGVLMFAVIPDSGTSRQATTDAGGNFDIGVQAGTWTIQLDPNYASAHSLVGPVLQQTIADGQTISGLTYSPLQATASIYGNVKNISNLPVIGQWVNASTTISGVDYSSGANTDSNGNYSFPVVDGTTCTVYCYGYNSQSVAVSGPTQVNFFFTPSQTWQQNYFNPTELTNPGISGFTAKVPSGAGFANLIAYAFGLNPHYASVRNLPTSGTATLSSTNYLTFNFTRNTAATDITYIVEASNDLTNASGWTSISTFSNGVWSSLDVVNESGTAPNLNVQVRDSAPMKTTRKRFLRLRVTY